MVSTALQNLPPKEAWENPCSAEYKGHSLNHHLLSGPDLMNTLLGMLCWVRQETVAITCDIEKMFYQVCERRTPKLTSFSLVGQW